MKERMTSTSSQVPLLVRSPSLAKALRARGISWERALLRFTRTTLKGSYLEFEHAQRIGSIYCQGGSSQEALRWNRLLRSESLPFCSTQLASLVHHKSWEEIQFTLQRTAFPWQPLLAEAAMKAAATQDQWETALRVVETFPVLGAPRLRLSTSSDVFVEHNEISKAFAFGLRSATWEHAVSVCLGVGSVCSLSTAQPLTQLALLKLMNSGNKELLSNAIESLECTGMKWTACVARIALRLSLSNGDIKRCVELVSYGHKRFGACFPRYLLLKTFQLTAGHPERTMELIVLQRACSSVFPNSDDLLQKINSSLVAREVLTPVAPSLDAGVLHHRIHENVQSLIRSGQWRNALAIARAFATSKSSVQ